MRRSHRIVVGRLAAIAFVARIFVVRAAVDLAAGDGRAAVRAGAELRFPFRHFFELEHAGNALVDEIDHVPAGGAAEHDVIALAARRRRHRSSVRRRRADDGPRGALFALSFVKCHMPKPSPTTTAPAAVYFSI